MHQIKSLKFNVHHCEVCRTQSRFDISDIFDIIDIIADLADRLGNLLQEIWSIDGGDADFEPENAGAAPDPHPPPSHVNLALPLVVLPQSRRICE